MAQPSYTQASKRHYRDALYLHDKGYLENADHLSGFAAECAIKGLIVDHLGGRVSGGFAWTRENSKLYQHMGEQLWAAVSSSLSGSPQPEVVAMIQEANPFADWSVRDRYAADSHVSPEAVARHLAAAFRAVTALEASGLSMNNGV